MIFKKGEKLRIIDSRKGVYLAEAIKDFDTDKDEWYPVKVDQEWVQGLSTEWVRGENIPCRNTLATVSLRQPPL